MNKELVKILPMHENEIDYKQFMINLNNIIYKKYIKNHKKVDYEKITG